MLILLLRMRLKYDIVAQMFHKQFQRIPEIFSKYVMKFTVFLVANNILRNMQFIAKIM